MRSASMEQQAMIGFESRRVETAQGGVFVHKAGLGPPLLLLHGFPQTSLMWRDIGPMLASHFTALPSTCRAMAPAIVRLPMSRDMGPCRNAPWRRH
ncbi:hypothetical protein [Mesorhizobium sp. Pch-S]|uniref:hypothetical protein n=1 Tax=Mesorhizobium sp. Pch-S TaxID=2082387 RepID=UPI0032AEF21E